MGERWGTCVERQSQHDHGGAETAQRQPGGAALYCGQLNITQAKQLAATEQRLSKMKQRKDPAEQLRQLKCYRDTDDRLVEECVSSAVAAKLKDGVVIFSTSYEFQGTGGDLDGLVAGSWEGEEVVVLVEAKHNMDSCATKAKAQLFAAGAYWSKLVELGDPEDEGMHVDYEELQVETYKHCSVMYAFGGSKFSTEAVTKSFRNIPRPWFRVVANTDGKFTSELQTSD